MEGRVRAKTNPFALPVEQKSPKNMERGNPWGTASPTCLSGLLSFPVPGSSAHSSSQGQPDTGQAGKQSPGFQSCLPHFLG